MRDIAFFIVLNAFGHLCYVGSRMTTALFALDLGASAFTVGALVASFAMLPMLLSVWAGRFIDRVGPRGPVMLGLAGVALGATLPFIHPSVATLYISSPLIGTSFMLLHIAMNSVFGAYGTPEARAVTFSWLALGFSISNSVGPVLAGFAIETFGHAGAMITLAVLPVIALALIWRRGKPLPRPTHAGRARSGGVMELLRVPSLKYTLIASGVLNMGWDIYSFLMPVYGSSIGLSASTIGIVMSTFALATFVVRAVLTQLVRHVRPWFLISSAMTVAAVAYLLFPFVHSVPLLMALSFLLGMGLGSSQPVIMALLYEA
ncbi:MAG TPA: MFS transporter, partial [Burkholderiales bacterium]|nr:MFS transporter [Burkholderiales bacterium]